VAYEFFPGDVARRLPPLYSQESLGEQAVVQVKFFTPDSNWTWYATEYDPTARQFFGLVFGLETELGYFMLDELMSARGPLGLPIERDVNWIPQTLSEVRKLHQVWQKFGRLAAQYLVISTEHPELPAEMSLSLERQIEWLRSLRGWTQKELAHRAGVSQMDVSRAESGELLVNSAAVKRICKVLDIPQ
jgi:DNA-binding XRE family transcriptional regulator